MALTITRREMIALLVAAGCFPEGIPFSKESQTTMSVTFIGESQAKPDQVATLKNFLKEQVEPSIRSSKGCKSCQFFQSADDPARFIGIEIWESKDDHQAAARAIPKELIQEFMKMVAGPPKGGYFTTISA
jgi:quinol monooxygenase YgiN